MGKDEPKQMRSLAFAVYQHPRTLLQIHLGFRPGSTSIRTNGTGCVWSNCRTKRCTEMITTGKRMVTNHNLQIRCADSPACTADSMTACHGTHKLCRPAVKHPVSGMGFDSKTGSGEQEWLVLPLVQVLSR